LLNWLNSGKRKKDDNRNTEENDQPGPSKRVNVSKNEDLEERFTSSEVGSTTCNLPVFVLCLRCVMSEDTELQ
jgi:hypothetical protein